jgi:hypothetical protein
MAKLSLQPRDGPRGRHIAEAITVAVISAAMYRLQETGDPFVIVWAAGAIILLTVAATIAGALEHGLWRVFGMDASQEDAAVDNDASIAEVDVEEVDVDEIDVDDRRPLPENC